MVEQILIGAVFILLVGSLVLTSWSPTRIFCCALLASYALGVVDTSEILDKVSNPGVMNAYLIETEVMPESPLVGKSVITNRLRDLEALFLVEIVRGDHLISPVSPQEMIAAGDKLIFSEDITQTWF